MTHQGFPRGCSTRRGWWWTTWTTGGRGGRGTTRRWTSIQTKSAKSTGVKSPKRYRGTLKETRKKSGRGDPDFC